MESVYKEKFGTPRQCGLIPSAWGFINGKFKGFKVGQYIWLLFIFHKDPWRIWRSTKTKVWPPKFWGEGKIGVFATRSPHRINPIGLSKAKILEIRDEGILVDEIDLVEGTPIVEVKHFI